MKKNDIVYNGLIKADKPIEIDLKGYFPIGIIKSDNLISCAYKSHDKWKNINGNVKLKHVTARFIRFIARQDTLVKVYIGTGYIAHPVQEITEAFKKVNGWSGADGIFSFNTTNGNDSANQHNITTTFVFGDTFVGDSDQNGNRVEPVLMPNNTLAYMNGLDYSTIQFMVNKESGVPKGYFEPSEELTIKDGIKRDVWFWLQDGVVIGNYLYVLPLVVQPDSTGPEGLQFKVTGVSMLKVEIEEGKLQTDKQSQITTKLYYEDSKKHIIFGSAIFANTIQAGATNPDGYIYVYGYVHENFSNKLTVAKVLEKDFEFIDKWLYFDGSEWSDKIEYSEAVLDHISCEMSVSEITEGDLKGKYIAVYQYNVNSCFVAYSISDNLYGPFSEPQIVYSTEALVKHYGQTTYTYNAKAHPHLSKGNELLVSYNVNTYSLTHNYSDVDIYRPRFIRLKDTSID